MNQVIEQAIIRARQMRLECALELASSAEENVSAGEPYLDFAKNEVELKARIKKQMGYLLAKERYYSGSQHWDTEHKQQAIELWERRFLRTENPYLSAENAEHFLSLHTLKAIAKSLDAHTSYYSPEEAY